MSFSSNLPQRNVSTDRIKDKNPSTQNKSQVEEPFPCRGRCFSVGPAATACGWNVFEPFELQGPTFLTRQVFSFVRQWRDNVLFCVLSSPQAFMSSDSTYFELRHKETPRQKSHNQRIPMFRLPSRGADSRAAGYIFTSVRPCQRLGLIAPLLLAICLFLLACRSSSPFLQQQWACYQTH